MRSLPDPISPAPTYSCIVPKSLSAFSIGSLPTALPSLLPTSPSISDHSAAELAVLDLDERHLQSVAAPSGSVSLICVDSRNGSLALHRPSVAVVGRASLWLTVAATPHRHVGSGAKPKPCQGPL